jgi:hypothetical protein
MDAGSDMVGAAPTTPAEAEGRGCAWWWWVIVLIAALVAVWIAFARVGKSPQRGGGGQSNSPISQPSGP